MYSARVIGMPKIWGKKSNHPSKPKKKGKDCKYINNKRKKKN